MWPQNAEDCGGKQHRFDAQMQIVLPALQVSLLLLLLLLLLQQLHLIVAVAHGQLAARRRMQAAECRRLALALLGGRCYRLRVFVLVNSSTM